MLAVQLCDFPGRSIPVIVRKSIVCYFPEDGWGQIQRPQLPEPPPPPPPATSEPAHGYKLGLEARKPVFRGLQTTQAQTSLRICTV